MEISSNDVIKLSSFLDKIHHTPGRLRVRVDGKIKNEAENFDLENLDKNIKNISGINDVKFNSIIGSLTILYDKSAILPQFWEDLLAGKNCENVQKKLNEIMRGF